MARHTPGEGTDLAQSLQVQPRPARHLDEVVRARKAARKHDKHDFVQPVQHLAPLPGVLHRIEKVENRS
jgi:hypothetical protein